MRFEVWFIPVRPYGLIQSHRPQEPWWIAPTSATNRPGPGMVKSRPKTMVGKNYWKKFQTTGPKTGFSVSNIYDRVKCCIVWFCNILYGLDKACMSMLYRKQGVWQANNMPRTWQKYAFRDRLEVEERENHPVKGRTKDNKVAEKPMNIGVERHRWVLIITNIMRMIMEITR